MGSVCSNSISSLGLSSHGSLNLSPLPNILQGFQQQRQEQDSDREDRPDSQTPVDTATPDDANIIVVSSSPMIPKPAIKRKSSNGSLKGGASQISANGIGNGNGGGRQSQSLVEKVDVVRAYPGQQRPPVGVPLEFQRHSQAALIAHHPLPARKRGGSMQHNSFQLQYPNALQSQRQQVAQSHTLPTRHQQRALRQDPNFHLRQLHPQQHPKQQQQPVRRHHQGFSSRTLPNSASKRERTLTAASAGHQCTCSSASSSSHASPSKVTRPRSLEFANGAMIQPTLYPPKMSTRTTSAAASGKVSRQQTVDFDDSSSAMSALNYGSSSDAGPQTPETAMAPMIGAAAR